MLSLSIFFSSGSPSDESQSFEEWFQDLQLSVNECFENPEHRQDMEASLQRLKVSKHRRVRPF